jgi:hypothetical protein
LPHGSSFTLTICLVEEFTLTVGVGDNWEVQVWRLIGFIRGICKCLDESEGRSTDDETSPRKLGAIKAFQGSTENAFADASCDVRIEVPSEQFLHAFVIPNYGVSPSCCFSSIVKQVRRKDSSAEGFARMAVAGCSPG